MASSSTRTVRLAVIPGDGIGPEVVREAKEKGEKINYGDATRREVLHHAAVENANALVLAMSDLQAVRRTVSQARELNDKIYIVVRTRYVSGLVLNAIRPGR